MPGLRDLVPGLLGTAAGLLSSSIVLLAVFAGFCLLWMPLKLRRSGGRTRVVRSLDEALGRPVTYMDANVPRGPVDQLHTSELLRAHSRNSA